jgi:hypothetical protein
MGSDLNVPFTFQAGTLEAGGITKIFNWVTSAKKRKLTWRYGWK